MAAMLDAKGGKEKKRSSQEKMTGVKNAQAEMLLRRLHVHYDKEARHLDKVQQTQKFELEHTYKLLSLDSKKNDVVMKKRQNPFADYSYDTMTIENLHKYLATNAGPVCWKEKKNQFKIRTRSTPNFTSPLVMEARNTINHMDLMKRLKAQRKVMYDFIEEKDEINLKLPELQEKVKTDDDYAKKQEEAIDPKVMELALRGPPVSSAKVKPKTEKSILPEMDNGDHNTKNVTEANTTNHTQVKTLPKVRPVSATKHSERTETRSAKERRSQSLLPELEKNIGNNTNTAVDTGNNEATGGKVEQDYNDDSKRNESGDNAQKGEDKLKELLGKSGIKPTKDPKAKSATVREKMLKNPVLAEVLEKQAKITPRQRPKTQPTSQDIHPIFRQRKKPPTQDMFRRDFNNVQTRVEGWCEKVNKELELDNLEEAYFNMRFLSEQRKMRKKHNPNEDEDSSDSDDEAFNIRTEMAVPDIAVIRQRRHVLHNPIRPKGYYRDKFRAAIIKVIQLHNQLKPKKKTKNQPEFLRRLIVGIADPLMETALRQPPKKRVKGMPFHAEDRSKRHTATYQLQQMVKKMMSTANKFQQQELDKVRGEAS